MIDWSKAFPIGSISRIDLQEAGFTQEQIVMLTDADMEAIALEMHDWYCDNGYWPDLGIATQYRLDHKTHPLGEENNGE